MNPYIITTRKMINLHGRQVTYTAVENESYDPKTSLVTRNEQDYQIISYRRHVRDSQYAYPDLVGKDVVQFYVLVESLPVKPKPQDEIFDGRDTYTVSSFQEQEARGEPIFYKIIAIRG